MRIIAISIYVILLFITFCFMVISIGANTHLEWSWDIDHMVFTFIVMVAFSATLVFFQSVYPKFSWVLMVQCAVVGGTLLAAWLNHMFPERVMLYGGLHLITAVAFTIWNTIRFASMAR